MENAITRELVLGKLSDIFPSQAEAALALQSLESCWKPGAQHLAQLTQLSILKLCNGELWRLRELVQKAKKDPRDVMYPAMSPELTALWQKEPMFDPESSKAKSIRRRDTEQWNAWLSAP